MKLSDQQKEFTLNIAKLILYAYDNNYTLSFGEAYRPQEMQVLYFKQGKTKTLNSLHKERLAVDFNIFLNGILTYNFMDIKKLGVYWCSLSDFNVWGGDFNKNGILDGFVDTPHFQQLKRPI